MGAPVGSRPTAQGERRQLAVLFCDVVDSTPLSQRMDAEEFGELMLDFQRLATETITGLGGSIGVYAGDGVAAWRRRLSLHQSNDFRFTTEGAPGGGRTTRVETPALNPQRSDREEKDEPRRHRCHRATRLR